MNAQTSYHSFKYQVFLFHFLPLSVTYKCSFFLVKSPAFILFFKSNMVNLYALLHFVYSGCNLDVILCSNFLCLEPL